MADDVDIYLRRFIEPRLVGHCPGRPGSACDERVYIGRAPAARDEAGKLAEVAPRDYGHDLRWPQQCSWCGTPFGPLFSDGRHISATSQVVQLAVK